MTTTTPAPTLPNRIASVDAFRGFVMLLLLGGMADLRAGPYVSKLQLEDARARVVQLYASWKRPADAEAWQHRALR